MNTITTTAFANTTILAIDLGKYKSVACVSDQCTGEYRVTTFETTRTELQKLIGQEQPAVIIIEACLLAGWVLDLCGELGVRCLVANTASEAWKFKHLKRKTDKDDALRLARKILVRSWAMLRDKKPWRDPQTAPKDPLPPSKRRRKTEAELRRQAKQPTALASSGAP